MKIVNKVKVNIDPLAQSSEDRDIPIAKVVDHPGSVVHAQNVMLRDSSAAIAIPINERKSFKAFEGKNLAEIMQNVSLEIDTIKNIDASILTSEQREKRASHRTDLANYIKGNITTKDLHQDVQYGDEKMSMLELAVKLDLGSKVVASILDKANYPKEILDNTLNIVKANRKVEKTSNYKQTASEIGGSVLNGAAEMAFEVPGGAFVGAAVGLAAGVVYASTSKIGETTVKDTKKLIKEHLQKNQELSNNKTNPKIEIEMSILSSNKKPEVHSR